MPRDAEARTRLRDPSKETTPITINDDCVHVNGEDVYPAGMPRAPVRIVYRVSPIVALVVARIMMPICIRLTVNIICTFRRVSLH